MTTRELEVIALIVDGMTSPAIAECLGISPRTVQAHLASSMRKLDVETRTQLAVSALRTELVAPHPTSASGPEVPPLAAAGIVG